jgi:predicted transposase YdaD
MEIYSGHDKFFKAALEQPGVAIELLQRNLPEGIKTLVDYQSLNLEKDSFIDKQFKNRFVDMLFSANVKGERGYF